MASFAVFSSVRNQQQVNRQKIGWNEKRLKVSADRFVISVRGCKSQTFCDAVHVSVHGNRGLFCGEEQDNIRSLRSDSLKLKKRSPCILKR
jgi:hypothetical protein